MKRHMMRRILCATLCVVMLLGPMTAAESVQGADNYTELKYGLRDNEDVRQMQLRLKELGYLSSGATGGYFDATRDAVAQFQASAGLSVNGKVASPEMLAVLFASDAGEKYGRNYTPATPAPAATPVPAVEVSGVSELNYGLRDDAGVRQMQTRLRALGYLKSSSTGGYWEQTAEAVAAFQQAAGLSVNGRTATVEMLNLLYSASAPAAGSTLAPQAPGDPTPAPTEAPAPTEPSNPTEAPAPTDASMSVPASTELRANTQSDDVRAMQLRLKELGFLAANATGGYYSATISAVEAFQTAAGLPVNGKLASAAMLEKLFSADAPNAYSIISDYTDLTYGMVDDDQVRLMQRRLSTLGYFSGTATGNYYSTTGRAVANFQTAVGLKSDSKRATAEMLRLLYANNAPAFGTTLAPVATPSPSAPAETEAPPESQQTPEPTPEPTPAPPVYTDLTYGMSDSEAVSALQARLRALDYLHTRPTGGYYSMTVEAVAKFQAAIYFDVNGRLASAAMQEILFSEAAPVFGTMLATPAPEETPVPEATPEPSLAPTATYEDLAYGTSDSAAVKALQTRLKALGFMSVTPTGNYYSMTVDAVKAFLKYAYMTGDGYTATAEMQQLLFADNLAELIEARRQANEDRLAAYAEAKTNITLKSGSQGEQVTLLTTRLIELGYLAGNAIDTYTGAVADAVKWFQNSNGLSADGVAGSQTLSKIYTADVISADDSMVSRPETTPTETSGSVRKPSIGTVRNVDFFSTDGAKYFDRKSGVFRDGATAIVTDIATGICYQVKRRGGYNHADVEPVTAFDTWQMYRIYSQCWAWTRRPVLVTLSDGTSLAASINGMPHGGSNITNNNMDGHTCIHFLNSRTHGTNNVDAAHQAAVSAAASASVSTVQARINAQ